MTTKSPGISFLSSTFATSIFSFWWGQNKSQILLPSEKLLLCWSSFLFWLRLALGENAWCLPLGFIWSVLIFWREKKNDVVIFLFTRCIMSVHWFISGCHLTSQVYRCFKQLKSSVIPYLSKFLLGPTQGKWYWKKRAQLQLTICRGSQLRIGIKEIFFKWSNIVL